MVTHIDPNLASQAALFTPDENDDKQLDPGDTPVFVDTLLGLQF